MVKCAFSLGKRHPFTPVLTRPGRLIEASTHTQSGEDGNQLFQGVTAMG